MSGIVGIVNLNGAPVDRALVRGMTDFMAFRGPDAQEIWVDGNVGFGHTLLKTTFESEHEEQPFTLDGRVWIVADARVDAQADLIAQLIAHGEQVQRGATDAELLLRAYRIWGEDCVDHLLGDFAFAVWDGPQRRLYCARDHLGVKPFFYAHVGQTLIFSNTLDCVRQHPAVADKLNDLAIADFLLFDLNQDPATTSFADIQRVPPAHRATWAAGGKQINRYWTLPIDEPLYFKRTDDYIDRFTELLDTAVSDRLRTNKIGIFMSGGLDSPTLAATACKILRSRSADCEVRAFTNVIDSLDQNERYYAGLVADWLRIPIHYRDRSEKMIDRNWHATGIHTAEPVTHPTNLIADRAQFGSISAYSRIAFYGEGPDNALEYEWRPHLSYLARKRSFGRFAKDIGSHIICHRRIPLLSTIPRMLRDWADHDRWQEPFPNWFARHFESRLRLRDRWKHQNQLCSSYSSHPTRPVGYRSFHSPLWEALFRSLDAGETMVPLETRHPFVDLRLLVYMLAVPAMPWCRSKYLIRRAMRGVLPGSVLRRPKSPLTSDPAWVETRRSGSPPIQLAPALSEYVDSNHVPKDVDTDMIRFRVNTRPLALNFWFQNMRQEPPKQCKEGVAS